MSSLDISQIEEYPSAHLLKHIVCRGLFSPNDIDYTQRKHPAVYLYNNNDQIVGFIIFHHDKSTDQEGDSIFIEYLCTFRHCSKRVNKSCGSLLLDIVCLYNLSWGGPPLPLKLFSTESAQPFYKKYGFEPYDVEYKYRFDDESYERYLGYREYREFYEILEGVQNALGIVGGASKRAERNVNKAPVFPIEQP